MFNVLSIAKWTVSAAVGVGASKIVGGIVKNHVVAETRFDKVVITAATFVISSMTAKATKQYTDDTIDEVATAVMSGINTTKLKGKLNRINNGESSFEKEGLDETEFVQKDGHWIPVQHEDSVS